MPGPDDPRLARTADLPDLPRWVEAHGIAGDPDGWLQPLGGGAALGHDGAKLIVVLGDAAPSEVATLAGRLADHTMLFERSDLAAASGRRVARALLHTLAEPDSLPDLEGAAPLPPDASLAHLPDALADELATVRRARTVWTTVLDSAPVSFAYAPWRSARWFDVSIDTLPHARQLGLGRIVAVAMIRDERAHGREPVWAADEDNHGSLRLARSLGFVAVDELWVAP